MPSNYLLSQIAIVIAYIFLASSYVVKKRSLVFTFNFGFLIFSSISFLLLSAYIGVAMNGVAAIRNIIFIIQNKDKSLKYSFVDYFILFSLILVSFALSSFTYNGFLSLFSTFSTIMYSISIWQRSIAMYKILGIPASILFIIYNISSLYLFMSKYIVRFYYNGNDNIFYKSKKKKYYRKT